LPPDTTSSSRGAEDVAGASVVILSGTSGVQTERRHIRAAASRARAARAAAVAYAGGFSGESYFIQAFRTHFGITPGQYKSSLK